MNYWLGGDYLGLGPGAHSHFSGIRSANVKGLNSYMKGVEAGRLPRRFDERLDKEARFRECFVTSMRLTAGVDLDLFIKRFDMDPLEYYRDELKRFQELGLFSIEDRGKEHRVEGKGLLRLSADRKGARIRLTRRGRRVFNSVMCHFI
jgi:oxygen-independent coproporphyrinogen-3 oxidase